MKKTYKKIRFCVRQLEHFFGFTFISRKTFWAKKLSDQNWGFLVDFRKYPQKSARWPRFLHPLLMISFFKRHTENKINWLIWNELQRLVRSTNNIGIRRTNWYIVTLSPVYSESTNQLVRGTKTFFITWISGKLFALRFNCWLHYSW